MCFDASDDGFDPQFVTVTPEKTLADAVTGGGSSSGFFDTLMNGVTSLLPSALTTAQQFGNFELQTQAQKQQLQLATQAQQLQQAAITGTAQSLLPWLLIGGGVVLAVMLLRSK